MKSLILKDLYNIGHNTRAMVFMLLVFACIFIPFSGPNVYIIVSGVLCSMMVMTTFSFDEHSKWTKYALVMPVTRKDVVESKFIVLLIFSAIGVLFGLVIGTIGGLILRTVDLSSGESVLTLLFLSVIGLAIAVILGGLSIPLLFKYGAEKARTLSLVAFIVPAVICFAIYEILSLLGVSFTEHVIFILLCCSPFIAAAWTLGMYKISYAIFEKKEL